jgi:hypothetical protein
MIKWYVKLTAMDPLSASFTSSLHGRLRNVGHGWRCNRTPDGQFCSTRSSQMENLTIRRYTVAVQCWQAKNTQQIFGFGIRIATDTAKLLFIRRNTEVK